MAKRVFIFVFTRLASPWTFGILMALAVVGFIAFGKLTGALVVGIAALGLLAFVEILKALVHKARPQHSVVPPAGYAFPSGHATGTIFLALLGERMTYLYEPRWLIPAGLALLAAVIAIGMSRILLRLHTPFEVAAGYAIGTLWAFGTIYLLSIS